jgi:hypothetical protein
VQILAVNYAQRVCFSELYESTMKCEPSLLKVHRKNEHEKKRTALKINLNIFRFFWLAVEYEGTSPPTMLLSRHYGCFVQEMLLPSFNF